MLKITEAFAQANHQVTTEDGINYFGCNQTIGGDYFCDPESTNTHPVLFTGYTPEYIEVTEDDLQDIEI